MNPHRSFSCPAARPRVLLTVALLAGALLAALPSRSAPAAPAGTAGQLDPTFGTGGLVQTNVAGDIAPDFAAGVATQPDGKTVVAGTAGDSIALVRYNANGTLDPSFGTGGIVLTPPPFGSAFAAAIALQWDGRIVVAGTVRDDAGATDFIVLRYLTNGTLDASFGAGGMVIIDFNGGNDRAGGLFVGPLNNVLVAGTSERGEFPDNISEFAMVRILSNGAIDPRFGTGGRVLTGFPGRTVSGNAIRVDSGDNIVIAGTAFPFGIAVARYLPSGRPDLKFGRHGQVLVNAPNQFLSGNALAILPDRSLYVGGGADKGPGTFGTTLAVIHVGSAGAVNRSFGTGGLGRLDFGGSFFNEEAFALFAQSNGRIVVVGTVGDGADSSWAVGRLLKNGTPDASFGDQGKTLLFHVGQEAAATSVAVQRGPKIVVAGANGILQFRDFALARLLLE